MGCPVDSHCLGLRQLLILTGLLTGHMTVGRNLLSLSLVVCKIGTRALPRG